jgi:hypothetical protein
MPSDGLAGTEEHAAAPFSYKKKAAKIKYTL